MARSMTAYGRAHTKSDMGLFLIEIHSVNRKSLDINTNLPKEFLALDIGLRHGHTYLAKPVEPDALISHIEERLEGQAAQTPSPTPSSLP